MTRLEVENVWKTYNPGSPLEATVLKGVSFSVEKGQIVGVVGPSGAGKSTLLHIMGMLERPSRGAVRFDNMDPFELPAEKLALFRNGKLGFVFQLHHLLPEFTALENVMMPLLIAGKTKKEAAGAATEILGMVGLEHRLAHRPTELSGGEQQRVAVARAAVHRPDIILADEPTGNLDLVTGDRIFDLLVELNRAKDITIIIVTHSMRLAQRMERVLKLADGELVGGNGRPTV